MNENRFGSPAEITNALQRHFGPFTWDLAAEPWSAVVPSFITENEDLFKQGARLDGLKHGYLNPPYGPGLLEHFISHARAMVVAKRWQAVTMLVPHYTAEGWWRLIERPEGKVAKAEYRYAWINNSKMKNWTRYVSGLVVDIIPIAGRLKFRPPPRYTGARESARFSSVVVRFVQPEAA